MEISTLSCFRPFVLKTTEYVSPTKPSTWGPEMPMALHGHCFVKINASLAYLIGGLSKEDIAVSWTWYYDISKESWQIGPDLPEARMNAPCGLLLDIVIGTEIVVVVGGRQGPDKPIQRLKA